MVTRQEPFPTSTRVRYIKLGEKGRWEKECLEKGIIRFGFDSCRPDRFLLCRTGKWDDLKKSFLAAGKDKGTAERFTNETRTFIEDDGSILWITFMGERLYWGVLDPSPAEGHADSDGVWRKIVHGWCDADLAGETLTKDRLSGALTKLAAYRGTSCNVDVAEYAIRRINGHKTPQVENALALLSQMKAAVVEMMKLLGPTDFETLVDLVFSTSGWRRQGPVGKTQKTLDLDLLLPSTGDRAFVQVKSHTTPNELAEYVERLGELEQYGRLFYVYHSHSGGPIKTDDEHVIVIGPEKVAELVLDAGLVDWLIRKVA
jgi:hypothetical protein